MEAVGCALGWYVTRLQRLVRTDQKPVQGQPAWAEATIHGAADLFKRAGRPHEFRNWLKWSQFQKGV